MCVCARARVHVRMWGKAFTTGWQHCCSLLPCCTWTNKLQTNLPSVLLVCGWRMCFIYCSYLSSGSQARLVTDAIVQPLTWREEEVFIVLLNRMGLSKCTASQMVWKRWTTSVFGVCLTPNTPVSSWREIWSSDGFYKPFTHWLI